MAISTQKMARLAAALLLPSALARQDPESPHTRVVRLLKELQTRVQGDGTAEQSVYDKYACWCESTTKAKAGAITEARSQLTATGNTILRLKGTVATTIQEIKTLMEELRENQKSQQTSTTVRQKESAAFEAERQELQQAIAALEKATMVLQGAGTSAKPAALAAVDAAVRGAAASLHGSAREAAERHRAALAATSGRYAPQSATIQGILKDMYGTFSSNLESRTKQEADQHRAFETLMHEYQTQAALMQESLQKKERVKAEAETQLADATQGYSDTEAQLQADVEFFDTTKKGCVDKAEAWKERSSLRQRELDGIAQALTLLDSDQARELLGKAIKPGFQFLQLRRSVQRAPSTGIAAARQQLREHARRSHSLRLAALAVTLDEASEQSARGVGHFDQVLKAIDLMMTTLKDEEQSDITQADECKSNLHDLAKAKDDLNWKITKNGARMDKLNGIVDTKSTERDSTVKDIEQVKKDIADMKSDREAANGRFKAGKADDEAAVQLLEQAKNALANFYQEEGIDVNATSSFVAKRRDEPAPEPEAKFSGKGKRALESKGIVAVLDTIVEDLRAEIADSIKAEEQDQLDYEKRLKAAEALQDRLEGKKVSLDDTIARHEEDVSDEQQLKDDNEKELGVHEKTEEGMRPSCDWIAEHLEERREKRATEMEGLRNAREYLAGAGQTALALAKTNSAQLRGAVVTAHTA